MAVNFNGATCCSPAQKQKQPQGAKFGQAQGTNYAKRPGAPGQVQFGIIDGGVVSGPCSCVACCCAPLFAIPAAVILFFLGKGAFKGVRGLGRSVKGLGEKAAGAVKRDGKEAAEKAE